MRAAGHRFIISCSISRESPRMCEYIYLTRIGTTRNSLARSIGESDSSFRISSGRVARATHNRRDLSIMSAIIITAFDSPARPSLYAGYGRFMVIGFVGVSLNSRRSVANCERARTRFHVSYSLRFHKLSPIDTLSIANFRILFSRLIILCLPRSIERTCGATVALEENICISPPVI